MRNLIQNFPKQLQESLMISRGYSLNFTREIQNVIICGLGGSGIGGEIVKSWLFNSSLVPIHVCHNYRIPYYAGENSLVIACSYSGNTEETLHAVNEAIDSNTMVVGISSGGMLENLLNESGDTFVRIPGGLPPRSALAYPLIQLLEVFDQSGVLKEPVKDHVAKAANLLISSQSEIIQSARSLMEIARGNNMLFYAEEGFRPVVIRGCQQINENSKELAFYNVIPELNHNEIVGWAKKPSNLFTVFVRNDFEFSKNSKRLDLTEMIVRSKSSDVSKFHAVGKNPIEQALYTIHFLDWLSLLIAEDKGIDVVEVDVIDRLKMELGKN